jgi:formate hydrogenlyase transcriptional activator
VVRYAAKIGRQISRVPREVMQRLVAYTWPGNIRELENVVERAMILSPGPELALEPGMLPTVSTSAPATLATELDASDSRGDSFTLEQAERNHIISILKRTRWQIEGPQGAARALNVHPSTLRSRIKKLGLRRSAEESS